MGQIAQREASSRWRVKNHDAVVEQKRKYREAHREQISARNKRWKESVKKVIPMTPEDERLFEKWFVDAFEAQDIMLSRAQSLDLAP